MGRKGKKQRNVNVAWYLALWWVKEKTIPRWKIEKHKEGRDSGQQKELQGSEGRGGLVDPGDNPFRRNCSEKRDSKQRRKIKLIETRAMTGRRRKRTQHVWTGGTRASRRSGAVIGDFSRHGKSRPMQTQHCSRGRYSPVIHQGMRRKLAARRPMTRWIGE